MLNVAHGGGDAQTPTTLGGKILRLTDEGQVPPDNPFVGRADARPELFTMGHRTFFRMATHPLTGAIWQIENGPNGGDEVNILAPGGNYGWPLVSLGRGVARVGAPRAHLIRALAGATHDADRQLCRSPIVGFVRGDGRKRVAGAPSLGPTVRGGVGVGRITAIELNRFAVGGRPTR
jgi:hypothetical protein